MSDTTSRRLTAAELGLPEATYAALLWVRDALDPALPEVPLPEWIRFDMEEWAGIATGRAAGQPGEHETFPLPGCGTAFCIGGTVALRVAGLTDVAPGYVWTEDDYARFAAADEDLDMSVLLPLFFDFPGAERAPAAARTPTAAVAAVDRLLAGETRDPWGVKTRQA